MFGGNRAEGVLYFRKPDSDPCHSTKGRIPGQDFVAIVY